MRVRERERRKGSKMHYLVPNCNVISVSKGDEKVKRGREKEKLPVKA